MFDPRRAALLLMDFQNDVVGMVDDSDALLARVEQLRATCRERGMPIVYVRVAFTDVDGLRPDPGELVVTKTRVGAFSTTNLASELATRRVESLVLAGIATSGVVLSTIRDAANVADQFSA